MVDLTFTNETKKKTYGRKFFLNIIKKAVDEFKLHKDIGLSVNLISKAKIQALNKKHRKKNKPTDVLSFPLSIKINTKPTLRLALPKPSAERRSAPRHGLRPQSSEVVVGVELGDIFICSEVVAEKSKQSRKSLRNEMAWVTVHGLLHLLGYDHERSQSEEKKMFSLQDKILRSL